jgi:hypothetical protein
LEGTKDVTNLVPEEGTLEGTKFGTVIVESGGGGKGGSNGQRPGDWQW